MAALVPTTDRQIVFLHDLDDGSFTQDGDLVSVKQTVVTTNPDGSLLITNPDGTTATAGAPTVDTNSILTGATLDPATKMVTYTLTDKDGGALPPVVLDLSAFDTDTDTYNTFTNNPDGTISAQRVDKDGANVGTAETLGVANTFMRPNAPTTDAVTGVETTTFDLVDAAGTVVTADYWTHVSSPTVVWRAAFWQRGCTVISGQAQINEITGDIITTRVTLDPDGTLSAGDPIDPTLTEIDPTQFPNNIPPCVADDFDHTFRVGETKTINVDDNDTLCANAGTKTFTESNVVNATVVNNGDGTFDVTPDVAACGDQWSFDYEVSCPAGTASAVASGEIEDVPTTFEIGMENATGTVQLRRIRLSDNIDPTATYDVTWPDGAVSTAIPTGSAVTHDFGAGSFTGVATVSHSSCFSVTQLDIRSNASWKVTDAQVAELPDLLYLNVSSSSSALTDASLNATPKLNTLHMNNTQSNVTDAALSLLTDLEVLNLGGTPSAITDAGIAPLTKLDTLNLSNTPSDLTDAAISPLSVIRSLILTNTTSTITDTSLTGRTTLLTLNLGDTNSSPTDTSISTLTNLDLLILGNTGAMVSDAGLTPLTALTTLVLLDTMSNPSDSSLSLLTNLDYLDLRDTQANPTDASIGLLTALEYLNLSDSLASITDAGITPLTLLETLSIKDTTSTVTAASNIAIRDFFDVTGTVLTQAQVDAHLAWFVANGPASGRLDLRFTTAPSAAGTADQATLEGAGWRNRDNGLPIV